MGRKLGDCAPLDEGELNPHLTQCGQGRGLCTPSFILIRPTVHERYRQTGQTDRQTDRQRSDSIGRTVLQTVAQKLLPWAHAKRDGRPAEYGWRPLFNAAKFGWRPLLECRAVTLPRRETRWNFQWRRKVANRSQPLVGRSSPYCEDTWGSHCCL